MAEEFTIERICDERGFGKNREYLVNYFFYKLKFMNLDKMERIQQERLHMGIGIQLFTSYKINQELRGRKES